MEPGDGWAMVVWKLRLTAPKHLPYFVNVFAVTALMNHGVAVGADGSQVGDWINFVFLAHFRERFEVMDMDDVRCCRAVSQGEVNVANTACGAVV